VHTDDDGVESPVDCSGMNNIQGASYLGVAVGAHAVAIEIHNLLIGDVRECAPTAAGGNTSHLNIAQIGNHGLVLFVIVFFT
jgi:hypothetical protein